MEIEELWKPIPSQIGYEASSLGRIRSLPRHVTSIRGVTQALRGRILPGSDNSHGYLCMKMPKGPGKMVTRAAHVLVAETFLGPRHEGMHIDHIDGNRRNNSIPNLRYVTQAVNNRNITKCYGESGSLGVSRNGTNWAAVIMCNGNKHYLGTFKTVEEAARVRKDFEERIDFRQFTG
jgi:hypothetical protein